MYELGSCPVGCGTLVVLTDKVAHRPIFHCPGCSCAWTEIPSVLESIDTVRDLAPEGVTVATSDDVQAFGLAEIAEDSDVYLTLRDVFL